MCLLNQLYRSVQRSRDQLRYEPTDVTIEGTADPTTATVTGSGATYNVAVSGMAIDGAVTVSISDGAASDLAGNPSRTSISADNDVTLDTTSPTSAVRLKGQIEKPACGTKQ